MKNISAITIQRSMSANQYGISQNVEVFLHRSGKVSRYQTNPILARDGRISYASVIRAKRAQLALVAQAEKDEAEA